MLHNMEFDIDLDDVESDLNVTEAEQPAVLPTSDYQVRHRQLQPISHSQPVCSVIFGDFEHVLDLVGGFGRYHILFICAVQWSIMQLAATVMLIALVLYQPTVLCTIQEANLTLRHESIMNITDRIEFCEHYTGRANLSCNPLEWRGEFTSLVQDYALICDRDHVPDYINTAEIAAHLLGFGGALMSDRFGRRRVFFWVFVALVGSNGLAYLSTGWVWFALTRILAGALFPAAQMIAHVWSLEVSDVGHMVVMNLAQSWHLNYLMLGAVASWLRTWRAFTGFVVVSGLTLILPLSWFVESPRWLIQKGRLNEAAQALNKIASFNGRRENRVSPLNLSEIPRAAQTYSATEWLQIFYIRRMFKNFCLISSITFCASFVANAYMNQVTASSGAPWRTFMFYGGMRIVLTPIIWGADKYLDWVGRRQLTCVPMFLITFNYVICNLALYSGGTWTNQIQFVTMLVSAVLCNPLWVAAGQYQVELYPTYLRNAAVAATMMVDPLAGILVQQIIYEEKYWPGALNQITLVVVVIALIASYLFLPETKGQALPDLQNDSREFVWVKNGVKHLENWRLWKFSPAAPLSCCGEESTTLLKEHEQTGGEEDPWSMPL